MDGGYERLARQSAGEIADYVIQQAKEGSVILMHDQQTQTADAMEMIIPTLIDEGFALRYRIGADKAHGRAIARA